MSIFNTVFINDGTNVFVQKTSTDLFTKTLHPRIYTVKDSPMTGFYLSYLRDSFPVPEKIYGSSTKKAERVIKSFSQRKNSSTGILMTGDKGTGKTMTLSLIANKALKDLALPVVLVQEPFGGERFENFICSLGEICLIFDEFGKMYPTDSDKDDNISQERILSLLDGVDRTRRLVIMTENKVQSICDAILNRPSRAYYHFKFGKLEEESIREYCTDMEVADSITEEIVAFCARSLIFSFDILQSLVEEHLRFGESIDQIIEELNIDDQSGQNQIITIVKIVNRVTSEEWELDDKKNSTSMFTVPTVWKDIVLHIVNNKDKNSIRISESRLISKNKDTLFYLSDDFVVQAKIIENTFSFNNLF